MLVVLAAVAGLAEVADSAPQAAPANQSPPAVSGTPEEGKTLTTSNGTWTGTAPITFTYSWRRCDEDGGSCSQIGGATDKTYVLKKVDVGNTIRARVTARNADGSTPATSVPTAVIREAPAPAPTGCNGNAPIPIANVSLPDRLLIDGQSISRRSSAVRRRRSRFASASPARASPSRARSSTPTRFPFNQFSTPAEQPTGADGFATLTMNRAAGFPATNSQQLLVVFARARKAGEDLLGGVSTRRLVSFPVDLRR